jgi:hypothetical protein
MIEELREHGYAITAQSCAALAGANGKVRELFGELFEGDPWRWGTGAGIR